MTAGGVLDRCRRTGVSLRGKCSFRIGGVAEEFYLPRDALELRAILQRLAQEGRRPHILGGGCNTLFPDGSFPRPVISTEGLRGIEVSGTRMICGAGERIESVLRAAVRSGLAGLEFFAGIPGTAGGAAAMNAGGSGHSFGDRVARLRGVRLGSGEFEELPGDRVEWGYRRAGLGDLLVTEVELELTPDEPASVRRRLRDFLQRKAVAQPLALPSAGCVFKNPQGSAAALLIDRAGLKGEREGGAAVSSRHANFIVNDGGRATAEDVLRLVERIRARVEERFGVRLETEIVIPSRSPA